MAKIVQILFSKMHQNYAKYTFETFTFGIITICLSNRKYALNKNVLHMHNFNEKTKNFSKTLRNTFRHLSCNHCYRDNI
jgi:hypothetical protein